MNCIPQLEAFRSEAWQKARHGISLLLLCIGLVQSASPAHGQEIIRKHIEDYQEIVQNQHHYKRVIGLFSEKRSLGEGDFVAFLKGDQIRGIIVQFTGDRLGEWREYYFKKSKLFFAFQSKAQRQKDKRYLLNCKQLFYDDDEKLLMWTYNNVPQPIHSEKATQAAQAGLAEAQFFCRKTYEQEKQQPKEVTSAKKPATAQTPLSGNQAPQESLQKKVASTAALRELENPDSQPTKPDRESSSQTPAAGITLSFPSASLATLPTQEQPAQEEAMLTTTQEAGQSIASVSESQLTESDTDGVAEPLAPPTPPSANENPRKNMETWITTGSVTMRTGPNRNYDVITDLNPSKTVWVKGYAAGGHWLHLVLEDGREGYAWKGPFKKLKDTDTPLENTDEAQESDDIE